MYFKTLFFLPLGSVTNQTSLFQYDSQILLEQYALKHDPSFIPTFHIEDEQSDPLFQEVENMCGNDSFCRFDAFTTRKLEVGNATKVSHQSHHILVENLKPGKLNVPYYLCCMSMF